MIESDNQFLQLDKISDDVLSIAPNVVLRFNVALSKISSGKRYHYHKEYMYPSKNYHEPLITIKRSFDYYLSFENSVKKDGNDKLFIRIGIADYLVLKQGFEEAVAWYTDKEYAHLYARDNGKLIMVNPIPKRVIHLPQNKYIKLEPVILEIGETEADRKPGISIDFGDGVNIVSLTLDRFMGLHYVISCFNMYESATILLNYISRPSIGTNSFNMANYGYNGRTLPPENITCGADSQNGRNVQSRFMPQQISTLEG